MAEGGEGLHRQSRRLAGRAGAGHAVGAQWPLHLVRNHVGRLIGMCPEAVLLPRPRSLGWWGGSVACTLCARRKPIQRPLRGQSWEVQPGSRAERAAQSGLWPPAHKCEGTSPVRHRQGQL